MIPDSIGLDIGFMDQAAALSHMAREAGASYARVRFGLGGRASADGSFERAARDTAQAVRRAGLKLLAVVSGDLTVAPDGVAGFENGPLESMAGAWQEEMTANTSRLVAAIGDDVAAWELLPRPNAGQPPDVDPERFAALLSILASVIRQVQPGATIVLGGLLSTASDDGVDYLQSVLEAGQRDPESSPLDSGAFDALGVHLELMPDGGPSEEAVAAALADRTRRLWRVLENADPARARDRWKMYVTGVSWDADLCGEDLQGRNAWTALDVLTSDRVVEAVIWNGLTDAQGRANGLLEETVDGSWRRRPAWQAFKDFSVYARQISPAMPIDLGDVPQETPSTSIGLSTLAGTAAALQVQEPKEQELPVELNDDAAAGSSEQPRAAAQPEPSPPAGVSPQRPLDTSQGSVTDTPAGREIRFTIPGAEAVLRALGLEGAELRDALSAVTAKYGGHEWLPPGDYEVIVAPRQAEGEPEVTYTNQQIISAMYRAAGGTWTLIERAGLVLAELAAHRTARYDGPPIQSMDGLTPEERERVEAELRAME